MVGLSVGHESRIAPIALSGLGATTTLTQKMQRHNNGPPNLNRSLSSRQTKKQKILLKMVSVICRGHLFMQHPASYGNSLVRGNLDDADAVGSCSNE